MIRRQQAEQTLLGELVAQREALATEVEELQQQKKSLEKGGGKGGRGSKRKS